jgi:cytochrome P450
MPKPAEYLQSLPPIERKGSILGTVYAVNDLEMAYQVLTDDENFGKTELEADLPRDLVGPLSAFVHVSPNEKWEVGRDGTEALVMVAGQERGLRREKLESLFKVLVQELPLNTVVDANAWSSRVASDAMFTILFSRTDLMNDQERRDFFQLFDSVQGHLILIYGLGKLAERFPAWAQPVLNGVVKRIKAVTLDRKVTGIDTYIQRVLERNTSDTFFSSTLDDADPEVILSQAKTMVIAGTHTTASQLAVALELLANDKNLQDQWLTLANGTDVLLQRLGNEHAPTKLYRQALQDVDLGGKTYPKGTVFSIDPKVIHQQHAAANLGQAWVFGHPSSSRVCVGKPLAVVELKGILNALRARCLQEEIRLEYKGKKPGETAGQVIAKPVDPRIQFSKV